jgi:hypothetical protein
MMMIMCDINEPSLYLLLCVLSYTHRHQVNKATSSQHISTTTTTLIDPTGNNQAVDKIYALVSGSSGSTTATSSASNNNLDHSGGSGSKAMLIPEGASPSAGHCRCLGLLSAV